MLLSKTCKDLGNKKDWSKEVNWIMKENARIGREESTVGCVLVVEF